METQVLKARWLLDGSSDSVLENGVVLVDGERIVSVGTEATVPIPPGARIQDFGDATILPGLIDCHTHWILDGGRDPRDTLRRETQIASALRCASHAVETLRCGVTSVRDVGCAYGISIALREAIAAGLLDGPRVVACGSLITMTGGHGFYLARQADGEDDIRKAVREQLRDGADLIKLVASGGVYMNREDPNSAQLTLNELRAAVDEARMAGVKVAIHAEGGTSIANAIEVGADTVEHAQYLTDDMAKRMVEKGTVIVPTIIVFYNLAEHGAEAGAPRYAVEKAREIVEVHRRGFEIALKHGVGVAAGTDVGGPMTQHHAFPLQDEIAIMVKYGMKPIDAVRSGTSWAARTIGATDVGTLEPGKYADIIVCPGSPLTDITALKRPNFVMKGGRSYPPATGSARSVAHVAQHGR